MTDEFNIIEEKTPAEKKAERFEKEFERVMESERLGKLIKTEFADIDVIMGVLLQTRGLLRMEREAADDVEEYLEDMLTISQAIVKSINGRVVKKKKAKKNE